MRHADGDTCGAVLSRAVCWAAACAALIAVPIKADPPCYEVTAIVPGPYCGDILGYSPMFARGLSNHDSPWIAGFYTECSIGHDLAFLWQGTGPLVPLDFPPGVTTAYGLDVTDSGLLIGSYTGPILDTQRGFIYNAANGQWTQLDPAIPGTGGGVVARAGNSAGMVVGARNFGTGKEPYSAFIWHNGAYTDLGVMNGPLSQAWDINESGAVTGWTGGGPAQTGNRAFLYVDGETTILPMLPESSFAEALDMNNLNDVVGWTRITRAKGPFKSRAVLWRNGIISDLGGLAGYRHSFAEGINNDGTIVGACSVPTDGFSPQWIACIWWDGQIHDLNALFVQGAGLGILEGALAINDRGQILCETSHVELQRVAVILTPVLPMQGDIDANCKVNIDDLLEVINAWGISAKSPADINGDGLVNMPDLLLVIENWTIW